jgi:hypothetical protein
MSADRSNVDVVNLISTTRDVDDKRNSEVQDEAQH